LNNIDAIKHVDPEIIMPSSNVAILLWLLKTSAAASFT
jgi:hypothetical protein